MLNRFETRGYDASGAPVDNEPTAQQIADFLAAGTLTPDETTTYTYDAGDRLLVEKLDSDGNGTVDQTTVYAYGENADLTDPAAPDGGDGSQQTVKTTWQGENTDPNAGGVKIAETTYTYNRQGRLWIAEIDSDGDGDLESRSEHMYDDSGIRVSATETEDTDGDGDLADETPETTLSLVDHHNPTGYQQVLEQIEAATMLLVKSYVLGLDVIAQQGPSIASGDPLFFLYDGHGSTRALLDPTGQILTGQVYAYDAYGNAHGFDPSAALTTLLYSGEQFDQKIEMQYLRARYYDLATGRFNRLDPFAGISTDPQSLHKYLYCHGKPIGHIDPTGLFSLTGMLSSMNIGSMCRSMNFAMMARAVKFATNSIITAAVASIATFGINANLPSKAWYFGGEGSVDFLRGFSGVVQVDALVGYSTGQVATYFSPGASTAGTSWSGYVGMTFGVYSSVDYTQSTYSVTFNYSDLPDKWKSFVREKPEAFLPRIQEAFSQRTGEIGDWARAIDPQLTAKVSRSIVSVVNRGLEHTSVTVWAMANSAFGFALSPNFSPISKSSTAWATQWSYAFQMYPGNGAVVRF